MDKILFSERLAELRKERGYKTQSALAAEYNNRFPSTRKGKKEENTSGILGTIKNYENANHPGSPNLDIVINLCEILGCDIDYLVGKIECKEHDTQFIQNRTGLSENAIDSLMQIKSVHDLFLGHKKAKNDKLEIINLMLADKKNGLSSFLDILTGFCRFDVSNAENQMYTVDSNGITYFRGKETISCEGVYYNPKQAHFYLEDMESMYYLKIWDAIKEIKKEYCKSNKAPGTS